MIVRFSCKNFRNVFCEDVNFARINILIGANNSGKSNFIRALSFAANMVSNPMNEGTGFLSELKRNGWDSVSNKRCQDSGFRLAWDFRLKNRLSVTYSLCAHTGSFRAENYICEESLDSTETRPGNNEPYNYFRCHTPQLGIGEFSSAGMEAKKNSRVTADVDQNETVLLQMDRLFFKNKAMFSTPYVRDDIRNVLSSMCDYFMTFFAYSCTSFNLAKIREMQDAQNDGSRLKKDGSNFVNVFARQLNNDPEFEGKYQQMLRRMINGCEGGRLRQANGKIWMELSMNRETFPLSEVSDGTVHLLILLLLLNMPAENGISMLAVDEPEMNLHPAWQKLLAVEILRCRSFQQCFISTHSPDFLDEFTEDYLEGKVNVIVFDPMSRTPIRILPREELSEDLKDWTLGDLYRAGDPVIGGWPQ